MPVPIPEQLGPLGPLAGTWEGTDGLDISFHNDDGVVGQTPYRERVEFKPFGPVDNGKQCLFGLDYRMAAWRIGEDEPFHTEVGYWLWDADNGQVMRSFMVPRGSTLIAGGPARVDSRVLTLTAEEGSPAYGILSNHYLVEHARTVRFDCTITIGEDTWSYEEDTLVAVKRLDGLLHHTDRNTLTRVD